MPLYSIQGPDGKTYELEGPKGATREQVIAAIQAQMQGQRGGLGSSIGSQLASTYRGIDRSSSEESGFIENILSGFGSGVVNTGEMAALGGAALLEEENELAAREKIQSAADYLRPEGGDQDALTYTIASGLGSVVGTLGAAAGATYGAGALGAGALGAGIAGLLAAGGVGVGAGAGEASERARAAGATEEERNAATLRGAIIGSLEILPLGRILKIPGATKLMDRIGGKAVEEGGSKIRSALTTGGVEAAQEAAAAFLQNMNERGYNPEKELLDADIIDEAIAGGGAGVIIQAVVDFFVKGRTVSRSATDSTSDIEEVTLPRSATEISREGIGEAPVVDEPQLQEGQEQGELFPARAEPTTVEADTGDIVADVASPEQINAAIQRITARGVEPRTITEEMVFDEIAAEPAPVADTRQRDMFAELKAQDHATAEQSVAEIEQRELDDAEIAEIEALLQADEQAVAELDRMRGESERETQAAAAKDEARADKTRPREAALEAVIGEPTTGSYVNLEKRFSEELSRRNIASGKRAKPTKKESQRIRRAADAFAGMRPQKQKEVKQQEPLEVVETAPEATQLSGMEARIPERKERAPATPSQLSFPGMGRRKTPPVKETPPAPKTITKEFMDGLGIAPKAPIRKRTEGKDLNDPVVREQFVAFANNKRVPEQTRLNVARNLEGVPEAQLELFQPQSRKRTAPAKGGLDATTRTTQPTPSRDSVPVSGPPVGTTRPDTTAQPSAEVPQPPRGRGVASARSGVSDPVQGEGAQQLALDLPEPIALPKKEKPKRKTKKKATAKKPVRRVVAKKELVSDAPVAQPEKTTTPKQVTPKDSAKKKKKKKKKTTPALAPKDTASKQLTERFEQQPEPVKQFAQQTSQEFNEIAGKERTTPDDRLKILTLLTNGAAVRDKLGNAVITYLSKVPRPTDGLYMAIFDVANVTPQFRKTPDMAQAEVDFFRGMGNKPAQKVLDWAKTNLSAETNTWIDETLAKEIREMQRIESTDYVEMFRQREAKLAAKEMAEQAQIEADMRQDARANLDELANMFEKKLARGSVMGLDVPLHPGVRGLLRAGNLKGALRALSATTPDKRIAQMAGKLADVVDSVVVTEQGLGMGVDARKKRAKAQGFDTGTTYYHGTNADFTKFSKQELGEATDAKDARMGFFFTSNPAVASTYADTSSGYNQGFVGAFNKFTKGKYAKVNEALIGLAGKSAIPTGGKVLPVYLRMENPLIVDHKGKAYNEAEYTAILERAYKNGNDGVVIKNTRDEGFVEGGDQTTDVSVVFDSDNIESTNAPFDPSEKGRTKIEVVKDLKTAAGEPVAGLFDPETNTIKLDSEIGMNPHVLLHEMTHAAAAATLSNKNHPMTRQLTKLFEDVKDYLDTAYGAKDVDEFVSEVMSNPEFQAKLAKINPKGEEINALQRFYNSVGNFLRKLVGMQPKKIESAQTAADRLIEGILAPAPKFRNANELAMTSTVKGVKEEMKGIDDTQKALHQPLTSKFRGEWADGMLDTLTLLGQEAAEIKLKLMDSQALGDVAMRANPKLGKVVREFHELMEFQRGSMYAADRFVRNQVKVVDKWLASGDAKKKQKNLNDLIYSQEYGATIYQVDPTKKQSFYEGKTDESGNNLEAVWKAQRADWNALGADGQKAYRTMRDMYRNLHGKLKDAINGRIDAALRGKPVAAAKLKNEVFAKLFDGNTLDVYFPLLREGSYKLEFQYKPNVVVKSDNDKYVFQMFNSKQQRDRVLAELKKDPDVITNTVKGMDGDFETSDFNNAPSSSFVKQVLDSLSANKVDDTVQSEIMRLFIDALPESSFAKSLQRRKGTPGYMQDAVYAMKTKGFDLGRQVEKLKYNALIQDMEVELNDVPVSKNPGTATELTGLAKKIKNLGTATGLSSLAKKTKSSDDFIFKTIRKETKIRMNFAKYGANMKGIERYVRTFNQTAFLGTIGFNTASAMVQLAQTPMFTYQMLGPRYGYKKAYNEIMNAASIVTGARGYGETKLDKIAMAFGLDAYYDITDNGDFIVKKEKDIPAERIKELERMAPLVKLASERGHLNRSFILDALGLQEGGKARWHKTDTLAHKGSALLDWGTGISAMMFNQAERFNRQVTMVAAYNMALERISTDNPKMPMAERQNLAAVEALHDTQEYNGGSTLETAPRITQENVGRVAMMYKPYGLRMYYTMFKTAHEALALETDPKARKIAAKQIVGIHLSSLFFAGVHGFPLYGAIQLLADLFLFADDEDDTNTRVRTFLGEGWYKGGLNQILDELGIGADVAARVRLSGLVLQENRYNPNPSAEEFFGYYLGGPALSVSKRVARGIEDLYNGETQRGIENILPVGIANAYKALGRYRQEGGIHSRRTNPIYDDMTGGELFTQFLGFAPANYIRIQEEKQRVKIIDRSIAIQRSNLTRRYYIAARQGDWAEVTQIELEIQEFNYEHPTFELTTDAIVDSLKKHMKTTEDMYYGVSLSPAMRRVAEDHLYGIRNGFMPPVR